MDYLIIYEEVSDYDTPIIDYDPMSTYKKYSAMKPRDANKLFPDGSAPYEWFKTECWTVTEEGSREYTQGEKIGVSIALSFVPLGLFFIPLALNEGGVRTVTTKRICKFIIRDKDGKIIASEDRVVWQETIDANKGREYDEFEAKSDAAVDEAMTDFLSNGPNHGEPEISEITQVEELIELSLYAADINPDDGIIQYHLIPNTKVGNGYFTQVDRVVNSGDILTGKELRKYMRVNDSIKIKNSGLYRIKEIIPDNGPRRYLKNYKLGRLQSQIRIKIQPSDNK